jgi:transposase-like protein
MLDSTLPRETRDRHVCPYCLGVAVAHLGRVSADGTGIRSEYRCRDCSKDFVLLSNIKRGLDPG